VAGSDVRWERRWGEGRGETAGAVSVACCCWLLPPGEAGAPLPGYKSLQPVGAWMMHLPASLAGCATRARREPRKQASEVPAIGAFIRPHAALRPHTAS
jgi:hypothetical protein